MVRIEFAPSTIRLLCQKAIVSLQLVPPVFVTHPSSMNIICLFEMTSNIMIALQKLEYPPKINEEVYL